MALESQQRGLPQVTAEICFHTGAPSRERATHARQSLSVTAQALSLTLPAQQRQAPGEVHSMARPGPLPAMLISITWYRSLMHGA